MPTWSADGQWIYFIRERPAAGRFLVNGLVKDYDLEIPTLERIHPDGSGLDAIIEGRYKTGSYLWSFFLRQPSISPDGKTAVLISDGPKPTQSDMTLKFLNLATGVLTSPNIAELGGLGHQDPAYSPDGKSVLFTKNAREGARGASTIVRYTIATKASKALTGPGYLEPAWSPDGRFVAATKTGVTGTDIVILDARTGAEVLRLTNDNASFAPVWSPAGDAIAFLRVDRGVIDLWLVKLSGTGPAWTVGDTLALTISAGLDGQSRESWFIPADQLPTPAPTAVPSAVPASPRPS
jgi:Tol biopolymer transport system component